MPTIDMLAIVFYVAFAVGLLVALPYQLMRFPELMQKHSTHKRVVIGLFIFFPLTATALAIATPRAHFSPYLHLAFMILLTLAIVMMGKMQEDVIASRTQTTSVT